MMCSDRRTVSQPGPGSEAGPGRLCAARSVQNHSAMDLPGFVIRVMIVTAESGHGDRPDSESESVPT
jgi:hypothetical protein